MHLGHFANNKICNTIRIVLAVEEKDEILILGLSIPRPRKYPLNSVVH